MVAEDILSKAVNDPAAVWSISGALAASGLVKDAGAPGGTAERVSISGKGANLWDVVGFASTVKPVRKGDVLLLAFWAKLQEPPKGRDRTTIVAKLQLASAPYTALGAEDAIRLRGEWKLYYASGIADRDYPAGSIGGALQLASAAQVIHFGPVYIIDFGPGYDLTKLPSNQPSFAGQTPSPPVFAQAFQPLDAAAQNAAMGRGVNVLGYDPLWSDPQDARFQPRHFKTIRDAGFHTVRIVLQSFEHMDTANRLDPEWLKTLDAMVSAALGSDLHVILDEHDFTRCGSDAAGCQVKVKAFWSQIAPRYKDAPNRVMFEILNEPNKAVTPEIWDKLWRECLAIIRASNPARNVVIGPAYWNGLERLTDLNLPTDDPHIVVTFHYYHPMTFTHQGAMWAGPELGRLSGVTWGSEADYALLNSEFDTVKTWSEAQRRPIFLGEFGCIESAPQESCARWNGAIARAAEARGFSWAYWQFDPGFAVYDMGKDAWVEPILNALIPKP